MGVGLFSSPAHPSSSIKFTYPHQNQRRDIDIFQHSLLPHQINLSLQNQRRDIDILEKRSNSRKTTKLQEERNPIKTREF
ncbi:hypothetical protein PRUPE_4G184100 [Prunus persica]|uniref:Uncharacterized protein n=1 Tax=Prunus persica TaxID=3760 RepID=A0A251PMP9_PRUPE|nr:hypothetical protein PRUPE_4G184100 [Prunus persica]